jgi:hypothetical protein
MKAESQRTCSICGNEFSEAMEFGAVCMLREALADDVESDESSSEDPLKPESGQTTQRYAHYQWSRAKTENRSSWVTVRWGSLRKRSMSICAP